MAVPSASVVLVEDSVPYARLVELLLADAVPGGVEVRHHARLAPALADVRDRGADCVLLDLSLPDAEGLEAVGAVRDAGPGIPIVVLSGHDDDELAVAAIRAGAQDYLVKGQERPPARFLRAIRFAIERHRSQERSEDLLRAKEDRWRTLTHLAPVGIVETGGDGQCMFANDWVSELTGRPLSGLLGLGWRDALHPEDTPAFDAAWRAAAEDDGEFSLEVRFVSPEGALRWVHVTALLLRDPWGGAAGWLGTLIDVTPARQAREELAAVQAELREQARTDPLTGLANRRQWDERLGVELARAARDGRPLCVAALDLDRFKPYNDRHGHQAGDRLLREGTVAWRGVLRGSDLLARQGGDEFALLLPDCDLECAQSIVTRLQGLTPGGDEGIGCSAGLVRWEAGEAPDALLARADAALYAAKAAGRGGISVG
jgi:diguanylate cyclase (GGDEF)-like protein/PAS domain S-box-containing protein